MDSHIVSRIEGNDGRPSCIDAGTARERVGRNGVDNCRKYLNAYAEERRKVGTEGRGRSDDDTAVRSGAARAGIAIVVGGPGVFLITVLQLGLAVKTSSS